MLKNIRKIEQQRATETSGKAAEEKDDVIEKVLRGKTHQPQESLPRCIRVCHISEGVCTIKGCDVIKNRVHTFDASFQISNPTLSSGVS